MAGCVIGIDIGSAYSKGVVFSDQKTLGSYVIPSGGNYKLTADKVREELLSRTGKAQYPITRPLRIQCKSGDLCR